MGASKVLLPLGETTVLGRIIQELARSVVERTVVVVGHDAERVVQSLRGRDVSIARNDDYEAGMLSSVRCGLRALPEECHAVLVALGDQPRLRASVVDALFVAHARTQKGIVVPVHTGRRGHPILVSNTYRAEILGRHDDTGLRGLLREHPDDVLEVDVPDESVLLDMDRPEDYARDLRALEDRPPPAAPSPAEGSAPADPS
jgi:molybdenum cofactor cytidylyltransferase